MGTLREFENSLIGQQSKSWDQDFRRKLEERRSHVVHGIMVRGCDLT